MFESLLGYRQETFTVHSWPVRWTNWQLFVHKSTIVTPNGSTFSNSNCRENAVSCICYLRRSLFDVLPGQFICYENLRIQLNETCTSSRTPLVELDLETMKIEGVVLVHRIQEIHQFQTNPLLWRLIFRRAPNINQLFNINGIHSLKRKPS